MGSKKPKHRITQFYTQKEIYGKTEKDILQEMLKPLYELVGKTIRIRYGRMNTPDHKVIDITEGHSSNLGKVLNFTTQSGKIIPMRIPDRIEKKGNVLKLVFEKKILDDKEVIFKVSRTDRQLKEDSIIEIEIVK